MRACVAMCAGAFDGLFFDIVEGIVVLMDWKRTGAAMRWFATAMSEPLAHVKDTKINRWRLQLNGYRFLLRLRRGRAALVCCAFSSEPGRQPPVPAAGRGGGHAIDRRSPGKASARSKLWCTSFQFVYVGSATVRASCHNVGALRAPSRVSELVLRRWNAIMHLGVVCTGVHVYDLTASQEKLVKLSTKDR